MDEFEEDVIRLSTHLDDVSGQINQDHTLADHKSLDHLRDAITKFLHARLDAAMSLIRGPKH